MHEFAGIGIGLPERRLVGAHAFWFRGGAVMPVGGSCRRFTMGGVVKLDISVDRVSVSPSETTALRWLSEGFSRVVSPTGSMMIARISFRDYLKLRCYRCCLPVSRQIL